MLFGKTSIAYLGIEAFPKDRCFFKSCHMAKIISKFIVLNEIRKILMVLRPYQYYATEAIVEKVVKNQLQNKNGYI